MNASVTPRVSRREFLHTLGCLGAAMILDGFTTPIAQSIAEPTETVPAISLRSAEPQYSPMLAGGLEKLRSTTDPVVVLLDTVHPGQTAQQTTNLRNLKLRAEELTGLPCLIVHYTQLAKADLSKPDVRAIMINNPVQLMPEYAESLYAFIRQTDIPTIGFCGGHHQVYLAFGGVCENMRRLKPGEPDPNPSYYPGWFKEWGFTKVRIVKRDPLFNGLRDEFVVMEQHVAEASQLPSDFELLASTEACRVQAIKHKSRILYGTQFHPEAYDDEHLDGKTIWKNFFRIAGLAGV